MWRHVLNAFFSNTRRRPVCKRANKEHEPKRKKSKRSAKFNSFYYILKAASSAVIHNVRSNEKLTLSRQDFATVVEQVLVILVDFFVPVREE